MRRWLPFIIVATILPEFSFADRGSIPFPYRDEAAGSGVSERSGRPSAVQVFEPNQRAMIAWNGREEILVLSTDLRASERTRVLEVLPLPAEPVVTRGDNDVFTKAIDLINKKQSVAVPQVSKSRGVAALGPPEPAGQVTVHKKIEAHDISVTRVLDANGFVDWVENYLKSANVANPEIPEGMKSVIGEYLEEGFSWFVFDVVELDTERRTNQAIQYRFATDWLYYPLKITRTEEGYTTIDVLVVTAELLSDFPGLPVREVHVRHMPVSITGAELRGLSNDMYNLLRPREGWNPRPEEEGTPQEANVQLRSWRIRGKLSAFTQDLIAQ
jgi:hypothetical protein